MNILITILLLIASYTDIKKREIPNAIYLLIALISLFDLHISGVLIIIPLLIIAMNKEESIGGGDIKLITAIGLNQGLINTIYILIASLSLCVLYYLVKGAKDISLPLAPFILFGFLIITIM